ncbi:hypothetical protein CGC56_01780 [Capnocytophaga canimorsus]|uniref:Abortive phage infection protein C-terminal domain-containing protein n=1 Tax=Capnocytophaga canimorsus TaxID=28188 RepID=A0A250G495_9FLAO|nr:AIPR family protein [Capnocytophaga canimorsus]ATA91007.1 hypothetical protein CGC56_01780 [Capnocytophaga canimorsus]
MDSIIKSYINNFINRYSIDSSIPESDKFEYFSTFSILSQEINGNILKNDLETISTGKAKGVDTIAFSVNKKLILNSDEINNFSNQSLFVDAFFIQSKTSNGFSDSELGNFLDVIIDFFSDSPQYNIPEFENSKDIYSKIIENLANVREFNLHCLYVSLGDKQESLTTIDTTKDLKTKHLKKYELFDNVNVELIDKTTLLKSHKKVITPLRSTIKFENKIQLTGITDVEEAYIGFIPFLEFKKLIMDESETKIKSLFNDNLRDFLGLDNPINQGIKKTLQMNKFNEFSLLNNGVTVIADSNIGKGNTLILENYQIVNGCQTSNVLFECKDIPNIDNVLIPLKVVITKKEELRDEIILTTNSQSKFTEEQLFAITQFQKTLEDFYTSNKNLDGLYYERRTNQYINLSISRGNIIEIREQLKSFIAMFFDLPHLVAGNIGKVIKNHKDKFFQKDHEPISYYVSGLLSSKWDKLLLREDKEYKQFNKYRYHIFMGVRYLIEDLPFQSSYLNKTKNYSIKTSEGKRENSFNKLLQVIRDENNLEQVIDTAINIFKTVDYERTKRGAYSGPITDEYISKLQNHINSEN